MPVIAGIALLLMAHPAAAHGLLDSHLGERLPLIISALLLSAAWLLYGLGARRVRAHGVGQLFFTCILDPVHYP